MQTKTQKEQANPKQMQEELVWTGKPSAWVWRAVLPHSLTAVVLRKILHFVWPWASTWSIESHLGYWGTPLSVCALPERINWAERPILSTKNLDGVKREGRRH